MAENAGGISVPTDAAPASNPAWEKAQAALAKVAQPKSTSTTNTPSNDMNNAMLQYYPWLASLPSNGAPPAPTQQSNYASYANYYQQQNIQPAGKPPQLTSYPAMYGAPNQLQQPYQATNGQGHQPRFGNPNNPNLTPIGAPGNAGGFPRWGPQNGSAQFKPGGNKFTPFRMGGGPMGFPRQPLAPPGSIAPSMPGLGPMPDGVREYVERAYRALPGPSDKEKLEEYLEKRLKPLLMSGAVRTVNWDKEPLPHEVNFELKMGWKPAAEVNPALAAQRNQQQQQQNHPTPPKREWRPADISPVRKREFREEPMRDDRDRGETERKRERKRSRSSERSRESDEVKIVEIVNKVCRIPGLSGLLNVTPESMVSWGVRKCWEAFDVAAKNTAKASTKKVKPVRLASSKLYTNIPMPKPRSTTLLQNSRGHKTLQKKSKKEKKAEKKAQQNAAKKAKQLKWEVDEETDRKEERARRFAREAAETREKARVSAPASFPFRFHHSTARVVRGTCHDLEKSYFRLTTDVNPATVRPLEVLERSLEFVKKKIANEGASYVYGNDQLRSIRQDLTVQCIRNTFTVKVYEMHARLALENADREEFNKCQSQLRQLYRELPGCSNEPEFLCYRILYYVLAENTLDMKTVLLELDDKLRQDKHVAYALAVRKAVAEGNFVRLFRLYPKAPAMSIYLMDLFVEKERRKALNTVAKAYKPGVVPVASVAGWVGMDPSEFVEWARQPTLGFRLNPSGVIDCRDLSNTPIAV